MAYSFTEKKRIRKDFGSLPEVMELPYLLSIQLDSYNKFLQLGVGHDEREARRKTPGQKRHHIAAWRPVNLRTRQRISSALGLVQELVGILAARIVVRGKAR